MAILETLKAVGRGEGLDKALGYLWISQDDLDAARTAQSKLEELNQAKLNNGSWTEEQYSEANARLSAGSVDEMLTGKDSSPWTGFKEGAAEGAANIQNTVKGGLNNVLGFGLGAIPWWVFVGAALYLAWRIGLLQKLSQKAVAKI